MNHGATRALIFDLGKVLIDFSVERACAQVASLAARSTDEIRSFLFDDGLEFRFERGEIDFTFLHQSFQSKFECECAPENLRMAAADIFTPMTESLNLLEKLRRKYAGTTPFILLSNTNEIHWEHIERHWNVSKWFDFQVLSFEVKSMKPHLDIYKEAIRCAGIPAEHCFFVDDVPENVAGARRAGLDAELFEGVVKLTSDLALRGFEV